MDLIHQYFPDLTDEQIVQFQKLEHLYQDWNLKINVVSRKDIDELYLRHVLHSLGIAKVMRFKPGSHILDVGTGSGCIIISILKERPKCRVTAVDISVKALNVAKSNAKMHHLENKIKFFNMNIDKFNSNKYDLILTNPPYINKIDLKRLEDDVKLHEPKLALYGGITGFEEIKRTINKSSKLLKYNGKLIIEIGERQANYTKVILKQNGFYINNICKDLSGKNRCIVNTKITR